MHSAPALVLTATVWAYWIAVDLMGVRVRKKTRKSSGLNHGLKRPM